MPIERIIVLEDDLIVRRNLEQDLRQRRYEVATAGTLASAQGLLAKETFDLIFVDVRLPDEESTPVGITAVAQARLATFVARSP